MPDAEVIPIGTRGRPGRGTGQKASAAARGLAAAGQPNGSAPKQPTTKAAAKKAAAKKTAATKAAAKKTAATKSSAKKTAAKKTAAKKAAAKKTAIQKTAPETAAATRSADTPAGRKSAARTSGARKQAASGARRINPLVAVAGAEPLTSEPTAPPAPRTPPEPLVAPESVSPGPRPPSAAGASRRSPTADLIGALVDLVGDALGSDWEQQAAELLAFARRRLTGDYAVDDFGFDPEFTDRFLLTLLAPIAEKWFRIEVRGIENIPAEGGALVVSNHSGTVPVDGLMTMFCIHRETGRHLRALGADLVFSLPVVSSLARRGGATLACHEDAERMLRGGELVGVWPEGFKGIGKPFGERYKLQRFGRGGFVSAAMTTGVPIVPLSVVGAEEIYPLVGNVPSLARLLGVPYLPITPLFPWLGPLGLVPLPSKWIIEFGEPVRTDDFDAGAADDPMLVFNVTDQVRETIQQTLYRLLLERSSVFGL